MLLTASSRERLYTAAARGVFGALNAGYADRFFDCVHVLREPFIYEVIEVGEFA